MPRKPQSIDFPHSPPWLRSLGTRSLLGTGILIFLVGCQSSGSLARWIPKPTKPSKTIQSLVGDQNKAGLPKATRAATDSAALAKSLDAGQAALGKYYQEASSTAQQAHLTEAHRNYQEALKADTGNPEAHHGLAIVSDLRGEFSEAELHYRAALEKDPDNSAILGDLGYSFLMQGRLTDAETFLRQATQQDPGNTQAIKNLACVYGKQGQYNLAETTFRRVLNDGEVQQEMARLFPQGRPDVAANDHKLPWAGQKSTGLTTDALKNRMEEARENSIAELQNRKSTLEAHTVQPLSVDELKIRIAQLEAERDAAHQALDTQTASNTPLVIGDARQGLASGIQIQPQDRTSPLDTQQPNSSVTTLPPYPPRRATNSLYPNGVPNQNRQEIQQTGGQSQPYGPGGQRPIEQALHETDRQLDPHTGLPLRDNIEQTQGQNAGLYVPSTYAPTPAMQNGQRPETYGPGTERIDTPSDAVSRLEDAKRRAAMVGMGGPEMMFPVLEGTQRLAPGTGSTFNGGQYQAPPRYLPMDAAPHDLNSLMNAPSGQFTTQPNDKGQLNAPTGQTFQNPNFSQPLQPQIPVESPLSQPSLYRNSSPETHSHPREPASPTYDPRANLNDDMYRQGTTHQYNPSQYNPSVNSRIATPSAGIPQDIQVPRGSDLMSPGWNQPAMTPRFTPPPYPGRPAQNEGMPDSVPESRQMPPAESQPSASYYSEPAPIYSPGVQAPRDYRSRGTPVQNTFSSTYQSGTPRITPSR